MDPISQDSFLQLHSLYEAVFLMRSLWSDCAGTCVFPQASAQSGFLFALSRPCHLLADIESCKSFQVCFPIGASLTLVSAIFARRYVKESLKWCRGKMHLASVSSSTSCSVSVVNLMQVVVSVAQVFRQQDWVLSLRFSYDPIV